MSKKRVHEIAKELKAHGIELDNREVVAELVSLGYDAKSHSSSLEDDQASAAVQKIVDKRKSRAAPAKKGAAVAVEPRVAPKGFVVRRRSPMARGSEDHREEAAGNKRVGVHQISKALKARGVEIDGPGLVREIVNLGHDVKSLSSTMDLEHAVGIINAILKRSSSPNLTAKVSRPPATSAVRVLAGRPVYVDGSNVCLSRASGKKPLSASDRARAMQIIQSVIEALRGVGDESTVLDVVFDASFRHRLKDADGSKTREFSSFELGCQQNRWRQSPSKTEADANIIARLFQYPNSVVVTNDAFSKHRLPPDFDDRHLKVDVSDIDLVVNFPRSWGVAPVARSFISQASSPKDSRAQGEMKNK